MGRGRKERRGGGKRGEGDRGVGEKVGADTEGLETVDVVVDLEERGMWTKMQIGAE